MDDDMMPGRHLVTVASNTVEADGALITSEMRLELMAARIEGLAAQNRRLAHDNDDLRQENRRLLASASQLRGENLALSRALAPARATAEELRFVTRRLEDFGQALDAERAARHHAAERSRAENLDIAEAAGAKAACAVAGLPAKLSADTVEQLADALTRHAKDARYEDAAAMLQAVQRSTSWRLTRPVRAVGHMFRR